MKTLIIQRDLASEGISGHFTAFINHQQQPEFIVPDGSHEKKLHIPAKQINRKK